MLDFGWQEFLLIAIVTVLVVGPKELPRVFRTITGVMKKARSLAGEFHSAMDDLAKEAELDDFKKEVNKVKDGSSDWVKDIDPTGEVDKSFKEVKDGVSGARDAVNKDAKSGTDGGAKTDPIHTTPKPSLPTGATATSDTAAPKKTAAKKTAATKTAAKKASPAKSAAKKATAKKAPAAKASAAKSQTAKKSSDTV